MFLFCLGKSALSSYLGHFGGNNVEQQLLPLLLTACRGHSGMNKSPFRAS